MTAQYLTGCGVEPGGGGGGGPSGSVPFGSAMPDGFVILGLDVVSLNAFRVYLGGIGDVGSQWDVGSILRADSWQIEGLDPDARYRLAQTVELVSPSPDPVVDVYADGILTPDRDYRLSYDGTTDAITGCDSVDFIAVAPDAPSDVRAIFASQDRGIFDIANPQLASDARSLGAFALGTFVFGSDGDLVNDSGIAGLRKRVLRRLTTGVGEFFHLVGYGIDYQIKGTLTPDKAARIAARARAQILQEPGVSTAAVRVSTLAAAPEVLSLRVQVTSDTGQDFTDNVTLDPRNPSR